MKKITMLWLMMLSGCFAATSAQAQAQDQYTVNTSILINKIYGINTIDQTYRIDGYLVLSWQDDNIEIKPETGESIYENSQINQIVSDGVWLPAFEFINVIGQRLAANRRLIISSTGKMTYNERFQGTLSTEIDFRRFPFDKQSFEIIMEPFSYAQDKLTFGKVQVLLEKADNENLTEWEIQEEPQATVSKHEYHHLDNAESTFFSRLTVRVDAERKSSYYLWLFMLPLFLIIVASWSVFWIDGFSERLATAHKMLLTVVAYTFYTSNILPRLPYTTFIEHMVIMGYLSIFTSIIIIVFVENRNRKGQKKAMFKLIQCCRYIFPCIFFTVLSTLAGINYLL